MNCLFCQQELECDSSYFNPGLKEALFKCSECDTYHFVSKQTDKLTSYNFTGKLKDTRITVFFRRDGTFEVMGDEYKSLLRLPYWPKLVPKEIDKLSIWITFS